MLSTWALIVCSLSPACFSACSKPSRSGWFAPCIACTRCSSVSAWSASVMQPLSCRSDVLLPPVSSGCQDEFAILEKKTIEETRDGLKEGEVFYYADEFNLSWFPTLRA